MFCCCVLLAAELLADPLCDGLRGRDIGKAIHQNTTGHGERAHAAVLLQVRRLCDKHPVCLAVMLIGLDVVGVRHDALCAPNLDLCLEFVPVEDAELTGAVVERDGVVCALHLLERQVGLITGLLGLPQAAAAFSEHLLNLLARERGSARGEARHSNSR